MRIGVDIRLISYRRGMGNFIHNLLSTMIGFPSGLSFVLYVDDAHTAESVPGDPRCAVKTVGPKFYPIWELISLPIAAARERIDILHCLANTAPLWLAEHVKLVLTIHDVMYMLPSRVLPRSPSLYQRLGRQYRRWVVPSAAQRAAVVITDSHHSAQDIQTYLGVPKEQIRAIHRAPNATGVVAN